MADLQSTTRSGKIETLDEVLTRLGYLKPGHVTQDDIIVAILSRIQRMCAGYYTLMTEHWDWIVVLQCMQDHNLFKSNPKRPPFAAFVIWLKEHNVPQLLSHYSTRNLIYVNQKIAGTRYPWSGVKWEPYVLARWRVLYKTLDKMFSQLQSIDFNNAK